MGIWVYIEVLNFDTDLTYIIPNCRFSLGVLKKQPMSDKVLKTLWSDLGQVSGQSSILLCPPRFQFRSFLTYLFCFVMGIVGKITLFK